MSLDELILTLTTYGHGPKIDVYDLLSEYVKYLLLSLHRCGQIALKFQED